MPASPGRGRDSGRALPEPGYLAARRAISIPLSRFDLARQAAPNPTVEVARLYLSTGPEPTVLRLLVTNRSNRTLRLSKGFFEYQDLAATGREFRMEPSFAGRAATTTC